MTEALEEETPFGCTTCRADPTHLVPDPPALYCTTCKPTSAVELCPSCRPRATDRNHPSGMIFVGWGHGWQPCQICGGSALRESALVEEDPRG